MPHRIGRDLIAHPGMRRRQRFIDALGNLLRRQADRVKMFHVVADLLERGQVRRVLVLGRVDVLLALAPDRRLHRSGGDDDDVDAEQHQFAAQAFRQAFDRVLRGRIGRRQRIAVLPRDRRDHHDPPPRPLQGRIRPEQRAKGLRRDDRTDDIDLHLATEFVGGKPQHRPRDRNAGIVDEARKRLAVERSADLARGRQHRGLVGDVEHQRGEIGAELAFQPLRIGLFAHAAEHAKSAIEQEFCRGPADAGRCAGDDDGLHG